MADKILCDHGYVLMQDSCPGCDAMKERKHKDDMVRVMGFKGRDVNRCRACGQVASHRMHMVPVKRTRRRAVNTAAQGRDLELAVMALLNRTGWQCMRSAGSKGVADVVAIPTGVSAGRTPWLLVQCKLTNTVLPPAERLALTTLAVPARALPLSASRADQGHGTRVQYRKDTGMWVVFWELTGPGPFERQPWTPTTEETEG